MAILMDWRMRAAACTLFVSGPCIANLIEDSQTALELRNFYMNRDFRQSTAAQAKAEDWAQGAMLTYASGFTDGWAGIGFDIAGLAALRLDSGDGTSGTGVLPTSPTSGHSPRLSGSAMPTLKLKAGKTEARLGTLWPQLPVLYRNDTRLLPQSFYGGLVQSQPSENLKLVGARVDSTRLRDSTGRDEMTVFGISPAISSDRMYLAGAEYQVTPGLQLSYYTSELKDIYRQSFYNLVTRRTFEPFTLSADIRYFDSGDTGSRRGGDVDNRNLNGLFSIAFQGHAFTLGYQKLSGDSAFPLITGSDPYSANLMTSQPFIRAGETSWQIRHDFNFVAIGIPGLSIMNRYAKGASIARALGSDDQEWERDLDVKYVIQSGALRDLYLMWRNVSYRSRYANDIDENRLIIGYKFKF